MTPASDRWQQWRAEVDLDEYETRWLRLAEKGNAVYGEADFVSRFEPATVLDAGCGMGRVGIELARRGAKVVGVDLDPDLLERARQAAPQSRWVLADLATLDLHEHFDVVVLAGNVIPFVSPGDQSAAVARCAAHIASEGRLVAGFSLRPGWPTAADYEGWCRDAGLELDEVHLTWEGWQTSPAVDLDSFQTSSGGGYRVFVHRLPRAG